MSLKPQRNAAHFIVIIKHAYLLHATIIFVSLGLGAVVAATINYAPFLITISQYKIYFFSVAAILLIITAWLLWRPNHGCPDNPKLAILCARLTRYNKIIFWLSTAIWIIGFSFTYIIAPLWIWLAR